MRALVLIAMAAAMSAAPGGAQTANPPAPSAESVQPRTGLICAWTMLRTAALVGRRCRVTANPGLQDTLEHSVARIEHHAGTTWPAFLAQMEEHRRRIDGQSDAQLCTADAVAFYRDLGEGEPEALRDETDRVIALPGPPEWGTCL